MRKIARMQLGGVVLLACALGGAARVEAREAPVPLTEALSAPAGLPDATPVAEVALGPAPGTQLAVRARRGRWGTVRRGRSSAPRAAIGGSIASWEPRDAGVSDALIHGFLRGYLGPTAALQAEVGYWSHGYGAGILAPAGGSNGFAAYDKLQDIPAGVSLLYFLNPNRGYGRRGGAASLYGGFGVAWHTWKETYAGALDRPYVTDRRTVFGYHYIAGLEIGRARGARLFGEYRYTVGKVDDLGGLPLKFDGSSVGGGLAVAF